MTIIAGTFVLFQVNRKSSLDVIFQFSFTKKLDNILFMRFGGVRVYEICISFHLK